jgi:hypothetical protein
MLRATSLGQRSTVQDSSIMKKRILYSITLLLVGLVVEAQSVEPGAITRSELKNKIAGYWVGQLTGDYFGFPCESRYSFKYGTAGEI